MLIWNPRLSPLAGFLLAVMPASLPAQGTQKVQPPTPTFENREVLPILPPYLAPITTLDATTRPPWPRALATAPRRRGSRGRSTRWWWRSSDRAPLPSTAAGRGVRRASFL